MVTPDFVGVTMILEGAKVKYYCRLKSQFRRINIK